jgi:hypothetical protein
MYGVKNGSAKKTGISKDVANEFISHNTENKHLPEHVAKADDNTFNPHEFSHPGETKPKKHSKIASYLKHKMAENTQFKETTVNGKPITIVSTHSPKVVHMSDNHTEPQKHKTTNVNHPTHYPKPDQTKRSEDTASLPGEITKISNPEYYREDHTPKQWLKDKLKKNEHLEKDWKSKAVGIGAGLAALAPHNAKADPMSDLHTKLNSMNAIGEYTLPGQKTKAITKENWKADPSNPVSSYGKQGL